MPYAGVVIEDVDMETKREASFSRALYLGRVSSTGWSVRVVGTQKKFDCPFNGLGGRLVNGLEKGCHLRGGADLFRTRAGGLIGVRQERGWVPRM
jgi:hypothetical protein